MSEELQEFIDSNPEWYKNLQYKDVKIFIKDNINSAARNFVATGYYLKYVRDNQLFSEDGYQNIWEFAQSEFGIGKSSASRFININDRFSKDGNSPILLEQYKDFSSSKLSEMLTMTNEQIEQVTITTTVAEIREIKQPAKEEVVATSQQETEPKKPYYECAAYLQHQHTSGCKDCFYDKTDCPYDRAGYFEELKRKEEWQIHCEVLKEMCDCICKMMSYVLEKNDYSMDTIKSLSRNDQEYSFGFGDSNGYSKYMARCKSDKYYVEAFDETAKWIFEAGEVDQQIWNVNGRDWHYKKSTPQEPEEPISIDDLDLSVTTYNCLKRAGIDAIDEPCDLTEDDVIKIRNMGQKCLDEINEKLSEVGRGLKVELSKNCIHRPDFICTITEASKLARSNEIDCNGKCCWGCPEHNKCGYECNASAHRPEVTEIVSTEPEYIETVTCEAEENRIPDPDLSCKFDLEARCLIASKESCKRSSDEGCMNCSGGWGEEDYITAEPKHELDPVETIEADIVQTVPNELPKPMFTAKYHLKEAIKREEEQLKQLGETWLIKRPDSYLKHQTILTALKCHLTDMEYPVPEKVNPEQPELPILKNNDQRKDFIDAYETWPIWIDQKETGERYYRYDLSDKVAMVVKVSWQHRHESWKETKDYEYGAEQYYLLGIGYEYGLKGSTFAEDDTRTFYECSTNKSALVEYLKDFQRKGAVNDK